jgi:putative membrane protein
MLAMARRARAKGYQYAGVDRDAIRDDDLHCQKGASRMTILTKALIVLVALSHVGFMILEMFFWDHPVGRRIFNMTPEVSASSAVLAANQGLYNGFLAAGLAWAMWSDRRDLKLFFLACVVVAGLFGGLTAKTTILFTQGLPALIALALVLWTSRRPPLPRLALPPREP